jgi:predicted Zn-dependent protease
MRVDPRIHGVAQAEKALNEGRTAAAGASVVRMIPHIRSLDGTKSPLVARAERVLALAIARNAGALASGRELPREVQSTWLGKSAEDRASNLSWAVSVLERQSNKKPGDPAMLTDLGEAMAKVDGQRDAAREILEGLAKRDLVSTPEGYRSLAELRRRAGDAPGETAALARCKALSGEGATRTCSLSAQS